MDVERLRLTRRLAAREAQLVDAMRELRVLEVEARQLGLSLEEEELRRPATPPLPPAATAAAAAAFQVTVRYVPRTPPSPLPPPSSSLVLLRDTTNLLPPPPRLKPLDLSRKFNRVVVDARRPSSTTVTVPSLHPKVPFVPATTKASFNAYSRQHQQRRDRVLNAGGGGAHATTTAIIQL